MSLSSSAGNTDGKCTICLLEAGKYVCPRCNIKYCSVACYRSPGHAACSEEFYRGCVTEELLGAGAEKDDPNTMKEILQRLHESQQQEEGEEEEGSEVDSDDSSDAAGDDLAARLAGINLDDADTVWEKLSREERAEFQRILASGDPSTILPQWQPWWMFKLKKRLVEDLEETVDLSFMTLCPSLRDDVPALPDPAKANPAVRHGVCNVVLAYALVARHYAGDHQGAELRGEAREALLQLSASLGKGQNFTDQENALAAVSLEATQVLGMTCESVELAKEDLLSIMEGPGGDLHVFYLLAALSDCSRLLADSAQVAETSKVVKGTFSKRFPQASQVAKKFSKKQVSLATKKLEFYIAWAKCQTPAL